MSDTNQDSWLDQLEVTGPIKSIMGFVDELSQNYDRRIAAMHTDYQKDIEEILNAYKEEKHEFQQLLQQEKDAVAALQLELKELQQSYKVLSVEHKVAQEILETTKIQLGRATQELKNEEELLHIARERIKAANEQVKRDLELQMQTEETQELEENSPNKKARFNKTREFLKQVMEGRKERGIILRNSAGAEPAVSETDEDDRDIFSY